MSCPHPCFKLIHNMTQYYVETDGKLYLVEERGRLVFPRSRDQIPFEIRPRKKMVVEGEEVVYSEPILPDHPHSWLNKEEIPSLDEVSPTVRKAVNYSLPRLVVEAVIQDSGKVLLVKPSRGYNENSWTLPGGFLVYGETPEEAVVREVEEEIAVRPRVKNLLNVFSAIGTKNSYQWVLFYYAAEVPGEKDELHPSHEVKELKWFKLDRVREAIESPLMRRGFEGITPDRDP